MRDTIAKGFLGVAAPAAGAITSLLPAVEVWLRILSLVVGIAVGVASFWSIVRRWNKP
jgi:hypothetical protein